MKESAIRTELTLPADVVVLPVAQSYVRELATLAGLSPREVNALVLAVEEACTNSIEHAYGSGESGTLTLTGTLTLRTLFLSVRDRGLPFDSSVAPVYKPPEDIGSAPLSLRGLGLKLINHAADRVRWVNHGSEGKELQLIKILNPKDVTLPSMEETSARTSEEAPEAGFQSYTIRRMLPEDALRVSQCFFRTFGYSYEADLYSPERLVCLNRSGEFISVVAVEESTGEVVGHVALIRPNLGAVGERTHLVVSPAHRGQKIRERMGDFLERELREIGLTGHYGMAVTTHTISQKASESRGMHVCGILPGLGMQYDFKAIGASAPQTGSPSDSSGKSSQRETLVFYFKYLVPPPKTIVHAPVRHLEMLARIYGNLKVPAEFLEPATPSGRGSVIVTLAREEGLGEIRVERAGEDSIAEIRRARRDLCDIGEAEVIFLDLPLAQAGTPALCSAAEEDGFVFCGVQPYFAPDGDFLRLVYLNVALDFGNIRIFSDFGRELLDYVVKEIEQRK